MTTLDRATSEPTARRSVRPQAATRPRDLTERMNLHAQAIALGLLIALVGIGAFGRFYQARFSALVSTTALEVGDVAQQLRYGQGFTTQVVRPLALQYAQPNADGRIAEMLHEPLYPLLLSLLFRIRGGGDAAIAMFNGLVFLLTGWVVYAICRMLWDKPTGLLATVTYLVSIAAIGLALTASGASLAALLLSVAIWAALRSRAAAGPEGASGARNTLWLALTGAAFGLTLLAGLTSLLLLIPLALLATDPQRSRIRQWAVIAGAAAVVLAPWAVRNWTVSGTLMPALSGYTLMTQTLTYPGETIYQQMPGAAPTPLAFVAAHPGEMLGKIARGLVMLYREAPRLLTPYLFPFFVLGGFVFGSAALSRSLWRAVVAMFVLQALSISVYRLEVNGVGVLLPIATCLAIAGLVEGLRRSEGRRSTQLLVGAVVVGLVVFPTVSSAVLGQKRPTARALPNLAVLKERLAEDTVIATDDPAAVAWYAGKRAVLLPAGPQHLEPLAQLGIRPDYIYLSHAIGETIPRSAMKDWGALLASEETAKGLGEFLPLPGGDLLFERQNKRLEPTG